MGEAAFESLSVARRVAVHDILAAIVATTEALAARYGSLATQSALPPLRETLGALARTKVAQGGRLAALARPPGEGPFPVAPARVPEPPIPDPLPRGDQFTFLFQWERFLESAYREVLALLSGAGPADRLALLAAEAAFDRTRLRALYLKYS